MNHKSSQHAQQPQRIPGRRGVIVVLTGFLLIAVFAFVALSVDSGRIVLTKTRMQNATDAAALAAAQEIMVAVEAAGQSGGSGASATAIALDAARTMAEGIATANGIYVNPTVDVKFGNRRYDAATKTWPIQWNSSPYNAIRVTARRTEPNSSGPDNQLPLAFGWSLGRSEVPIQTSATAFIEARDLVVVLDFSGSMNDDSSIRSFNTLGQAQVEASLDGMWDALRDADPKWPGTSESKFPADGFGLINSYYGTYNSSTDITTIYNALHLNELDDSGNMKYPWPQAGRYSSGMPKSKPSDSTSKTRWRYYISYVKGRSGTYGKRYGYRSLMDYLQESRYSSAYSEDLWRTPHYPFHAIKEGATLFLDYLTDLDFDDEVGLVSYGQWAVQEMTHIDGEVSIDISDNPITTDYASIDTIQRRHQAGDYNAWTGMGDGILKANDLLLGDPNDSNDDGHVRVGARPTMIIMTDGQTNQGPDGWSLPADFNWAEWTDYDGNGSANYSTTDWKKQYAFWEATQAIERGITLHTMTVGAGADRALMEAIAFAGGGIFISVPGGTTTAEMESQLIEAFQNIAAKLPPPKLVYDMTSGQ
jgi:Flp pilus assembly protein TadG